MNNLISEFTARAEAEGFTPEEISFLVCGLENDESESAHEYMNWLMSSPAEMLRAYAWA